jgi:hypothetical protein
LTVLFALSSIHPSAHTFDFSDMRVSAASRQSAGFAAEVPSKQVALVFQSAADLCHCLDDAAAALAPHVLPSAVVVRVVSCLLICFIQDLPRSAALQQVHGAQTVRPAATKAARVFYGWPIFEAETGDVEPVLVLDSKGQPLTAQHDLVVDSLSVAQSALQAAVEAAAVMLRVDDVIQNTR